MGVTFLARGAAGQAAAEEQKHEREIHRGTMGKAFRFWLNRGKEAQVIFVDGELDHQGFLLPPRAWEHRHFRNSGQRKTPDFYLCPEKNQPKAGVRCPICADGDYPSFNAYFTVIERANPPYTDKNGVVHYFSKRLFVAPATVMDKLLKYAQHCGGLAGQMFSIARSDNEKSSRVGDVFVPMEKRKPEEWAPLFMEAVVDKQGKPTGQMQSVFTAFNYDEETNQLSAEDLMTLGFGHGSSQSSFSSRQQAAQVAPPGGFGQPGSGFGASAAPGAGADPFAKAGVAPPQTAPAMTPGHTSATVEVAEDKDIDDVIG